MPLLGGLLVTLFTSLLTVVGGYFTKKVATTTVAIAMMSGLTLALFVFMRLTLAGLNSYAHGAPPVFMQALQMMVPPAAPFCISTYITVWSATMVYAWRKDMLAIAVKA